MKKPRYGATSQLRFAVLAIVFTVLGVDDVYAQQATSKGRSPAAGPGTSARSLWREEPDSFMGLKFGQPVANQIEECPKRSSSLGTGYYDYEDSRIRREKLRCFKRLAAHLYEVENPPSIGLWIGKVTALVADEKFEGMSFVFQHIDTSKVFELFKARYGSPTKVERQTLQTRGGATLTGNEYTWSGRTLTILLSEYGSRIDEGSVYVVTKAYEQSRERSKKENAERYKDKL